MNRLGNEMEGEMKMWEGKKGKEEKETKAKKKGREKGKKDI